MRIPKCTIYARQLRSTFGFAFAYVVYHTDWAQNTRCGICLAHCNFCFCDFHFGIGMLWIKSVPCFSWVSLFLRPVSLLCIFIQLYELHGAENFNSLLFVLACNHFSPSGLMFAFRRFCFRCGRYAAKMWLMYWAVLLMRWKSVPNYGNLWIPRNDRNFLCFIMMSE